MLCLDGIPSTSISITTLNNENLRTEKIFNSSDHLILVEFIEQLNKYAHTREQLMNNLMNHSISSSNDLKIQSSILAQLTGITNQLTRKTLVEKKRNIFILFLIFIRL